MRARELAGEAAGDGVFWAPVREAASIIDEDILLSPDGSFVTHLHAHPGRLGCWQTDGTSLVLTPSPGAGGPEIVTSVRVKGRTLSGRHGGSELIWRRLDPREPPRRR